MEKLHKDHLLTTHRSQQAWYCQSAELRVQELILITEKNLRSCLYIFSANLKLPRMRYRKKCLE